MGIAIEIQKVPMKCLCQHEISLCPALCMGLFAYSAMSCLDWINQDFTCHWDICGHLCWLQPMAWRVSDLMAMTMSFDEYDYLISFRYWCTISIGYLGDWYMPFQRECAHLYPSLLCTCSLEMIRNQVVILQWTQSIEFPINGRNSRISCTTNNLTISNHGVIR